MYEIQKRFTTLHLRDDLTLLNYLKSQKFDVGISFNQDFESFVLSAAGIPILREGAHLPNSVNQLLSRSPSQVNWESPLIMWDHANPTSFAYRLFREVLANILYFS